MCYNSCSYFFFNPMDGTDKCTLPKDVQCPMDDPLDEEETEDEEPEDSPGA